MVLNEDFIKLYEELSDEYDTPSDKELYNKFCDVICQKLKRDGTYFGATPDGWANPLIYGGMHLFYKFSLHYKDASVDDKLTVPILYTSFDEKTNKWTIIMYTYTVCCSGRYHRGNPGCTWLKPGKNKLCIPNLDQKGERIDGTGFKDFLNAFKTLRWPCVMPDEEATAQGYKPVYLRMSFFYSELDKEFGS